MIYAHERNHHPVNLGRHYVVHCKQFDRVMFDTLDVGRTLRIKGNNGVIMHCNLGYNDIRLSRNALAITETELKLIAAAAIIGDSKMPKRGYNIPAAIGTPRAL